MLDASQIELNYNILPVEKWVNDPFYVGKRVIYPFWKDEFIKHRRSGNIKYVCYGSYGIGKTYFSIALDLLRELYEIHAYRNFPGLFGLDSSTKLKIAFISITKTKSDSTGIEKLIRIVDSIPFFQTVIRRQRDIKSQIKFPQIDISPASILSHVTGEDLYGVIFDESNFIRAKAGDEYQKAKDLFMEAQLRGSTRFSVGGYQCGLFGLLSSAQDETSFTEKYISERRIKGDASIICSAIYKIKPEAYSTETFDVFVGYNDIEPFIVDQVKPETVAYINKNYGQTLEDFLTANKNLIEKVPVSLRDFYESDIKASLKSISGIPQKLSALLLKNPSWLKRAFKDSMKSPLMSPVLLSFGSDESIEDYIDEVILLNQYDGEPVYIHFDLMKNKDEGGFGAFYKTVEGNRFRSLLYFAFRQSKEREKVDYQKIIDICFWLTDIGVSIKKITFDQYQSEMPTQILEKKYGKDRVGYQSVDREDTAYMTFNYLLKKGLVDMYSYPHFEKQYKMLLYDKQTGKVDHPEGSDKGSSDSVVGSVFSCYIGEGIDREDVVIQDIANKQSGDIDFYSDMVIPDDGFYSALLNGEESKDLSRYEKQMEKEGIKKGDIDDIMRKFEEDYD
jgi:hypothetical protein